jgi:hypothetical protein
MMLIYCAKTYMQYHKKQKFSEIAGQEVNTEN